MGSDSSPTRVRRPDGAGVVNSAGLGTPTMAAKSTPGCSAASVPGERPRPIGRSSMRSTAPGAGVAVAGGFRVLVVHRPEIANLDTLLSTQVAEARTESGPFGEHRDPAHPLVGRHRAPEALPPVERRGGGGPYGLPPSREAVTAA